MKKYTTEECNHNIKELLPNMPITNWFPRRIYLCGGGIRTSVHVGALKELEKRGLLKNIREWSGVSAGALIAFCIAIGFTLDELDVFCSQFNFMEIVHVDSLPGLLTNFGIDDGERLNRLLEACLHVKGFRSTLTFREAPTNVRFFATDLCTQKMVVFSNTTTPDCPITFAVRASMAFPYYFQPLRNPSDGHYLADGGIISNYAKAYFTEQEQKELLSIVITDNPTVERNMNWQMITSRPVIISVQQKHIDEYNLSTDNTIKIQITNVNALSFDLSESKKKELIELGRQSAIRELDASVAELRKNIRRWSVS